MSGLDGGGFVNVVAFDPSGSGVVLAGGDVSGIQRSTDDGTTWSAANAGVRSLSQLKVASIVFSPSTPGRVYAAVGDQGSGGALLVSTDDGRSWSPRSDVPRFSGGNNDGTSLPDPHPRSTGTLLAVDPSRQLLYAATFADGVMRSSDDGRTWTGIGLAGSYLRGIAIDPTNPDVLYVAAYGEGVERTTDASGAGPFTVLPGSPATPEELAIVGDTLYAAAGPEGVVATSDGGGTWRSLRQGGADVWESIAGYAACGQTVLYAGTAEGGPASLQRSTDGGATWALLAADRTKIHLSEGGPEGPRWWLGSQPNFLLAGSTYVASQIAVDPQAPPGGTCLRPRVLVAGRAGVWGSTDAGGSWYPMVRGMGVTIVHQVVVDPASPARLYAAAADWVLLGSTDGGVSFPTGAAGAGTGFDVALDVGSDPAAAYVAVASADRGGGDVDVSVDPLSHGWASTGLAAVSGGRVEAVAVQRVSGRSVVLAAVDGSGIWRKDGASEWISVDPGALPTPDPPGGVSFAWPSASSAAYLYDRETGLWRSSDAGVTWTPVWAKPSVPPYTGSVAADPTTPGRVFVSIGDDGLFRLDGADTGTVDAGSVRPVRVGSFPHPGPVTVNGGGAVYASELGVGGPPDLRLSTDAGGDWRSLADDAYRSAALFPLSVTVSPDATLYLALDGNGVLIGHPAG